MFDLKGSKFSRKILDAEVVKKSILSHEGSQKLGKREKQKLNKMIMQTNIGTEQSFPSELRKQLSFKIMRDFEDTTLKDQDFEILTQLQLQNIDVAPADIKLILLTLERDVQFLQEMGLMDYSLLLGIEQVSEAVMVDNAEFESQD